MLQLPRCFSLPLLEETGPLAKGEQLRPGRARQFAGGCWGLAGSCTRARAVIIPQVPAGLHRDKLMVDRLLAPAHQSGAREVIEQHKELQTEFFLGYQPPSRAEGPEHKGLW